MSPYWDMTGLSARVTAKERWLATSKSVVSRPPSVDERHVVSNETPGRTSHGCQGYVIAWA